jgi:F-type H+-transporting ATPase subunit a
VLVDGLREQIAAVSRQDPHKYLDFIGTLFIFIAVSNLLTIIPGYVAPTGSLSTTSGLATCVFLAVPIYGIQNQGITGYLRHYIRPSIFMTPFTIIGEFSRTIALSVRLFGNIMSGHIIIAILISIVPFIFPVVMQALGLLTGLIQAYIFPVLAMVYIASGSRVYREKHDNQQQTAQKEEQTHG